MIRITLGFFLFAFLLAGCGDKTRQPTSEYSLPDNVDHIIYVAPTLEEGMDKIGSVLGVRPIPGGRHPQYGTHNALLSLGDATYLEVIAPDPSLTLPDRGVLFYSPNGRTGMKTWVMRAEDIDSVLASAQSNGVALGNIESGEREKPDGAILRWRLTDPYALPFDGAVPFLISWGDTPHPSGAAPSGGRLIGLRIKHPDPESVQKALNAIGVDMDVRAGDEYRLMAFIKTANGVVEID